MPAATAAGEVALCVRSEPRARYDGSSAVGSQSARLLRCGMAAQIGDIHHHAGRQFILKPARPVQDRARPGQSVLYQATAWPFRNVGS